jgi:hypothetical protein
MAVAPVVIALHLVPAGRAGKPPPERPLAVFFAPGLLY